MVNFVTGAPSALLLFEILFLASFAAAAKIRVAIVTEPNYLQERVNNTMDFTVRCTVRESIYRYNRHSRASRVLARIRILVQTKDYGPWHPMAQISDVEPSLVYVDPAYPHVDSVGTISSNMVTKDSGLSVKWVGSTLDAVNRFRCDAITFDKSYSDSGSYQFSDARIQTTNLNSYSLAQLSALEKESSLKKIRAASVMADGNNLPGDQAREISKTRAEIEEIIQRLKLRLAEAKRAQTVYAGKMTQLLNDLITPALENQTREIENVESTLENAVKGSFLMLWPNGTYALPMPSTGCPSTNDQTWRHGYRRHHTESLQRNEDTASENIHLKQPVLNRSRDKFYIFQHFCVRTEESSFGPDWPRGSYCINKAGRVCPSNFNLGSISWDEEDFRSQASASGEMPSGDYGESKTKLYYCCRDDGSADEPVDMPRYQPFYLYRFQGECQKVVGMKATEEFIHFDTENSNNGDEKWGAHPDVELDDIILRLCYYEMA